MRRPAWVPWWRVATTVLLSVALVVSAIAGRTVDAIIIGIFLVPSLVLIGLWVFAWKRDQLADDA